MKKLVAVIGVLILGLAIVAGCGPGQAPAPAPTPAPPETPAQFYQGKTIDWIVSSDVGSSTDLTVRMIAPHVAAEIGAKIVVRNMGTEEGINYAYAEGTKDGLTLLSNHFGSLVSNDVLGAPGVRYEAEKFIYIVDMWPGRRVVSVTPGGPYTTYEAFIAGKGMKAGATSARGGFVTTAVLVIEALGLDAKAITGYQGAANLTLAVARGEVDFMAGGDDDAAVNEKAGTLMPLFAFSDARAATLPHVPTIFELGFTLPQNLQSAFDFVASTDGSAVALPPGVPQDRVEYLRDAFMKAGENEELQNDMLALAEPFVPFRSGETLQQIAMTIAADTEIGEAINNLRAKHSMVK